MWCCRFFLSQSLVKWCFRGHNNTATSGSQFGARVQFHQNNWWIVHTTPAYDQFLIDYCTRVECVRFSRVWRTFIAMILTKENNGKLFGFRAMLVVFLLRNIFFCLSCFCVWIPKAKKIYSIKQYVHVYTYIRCRRAMVKRWTTFGLFAVWILRCVYVEGVRWFSVFRWPFVFQFEYDWINTIHQEEKLYILFGFCVVFLLFLL